MTKERTVLEFFVAHNHIDYDLAQQVKWSLEEQGVSGFLAPHDIVPSEQWRIEIMTHLGTCHALIAVVTPRFGQSVYAIQETAMVMGKGKPTIPFRFENAELPGFIESIHAVQVTRETISDAVRKAVNIVNTRDPAFIRTGFIPHSEAKRIVIEEIRNQIL